MGLKLFSWLATLCQTGTALHKIYNSSLKTSNGAPPVPHRSSHSHHSNVFHCFPHSQVTEQTVL